MGKHIILLGTANWLEPNWVGSFYPEDMPAEWRLAYYSTQFSCVWLANEVWRRITPKVAEEWVSDTRAGFRFLLEAGDGDTAHEKRLLEILAPRLGLHCKPDHPDLLWFGSEVNLRNLSDTLRHRASSGGVTYLLSRNADLATLNKVDTLLGLLIIGPDGRVG